MTARATARNPGSSSTVRTRTAPRAGPTYGSWVRVTPSTALLPTLAVGIACRMVTRRLAGGKPACMGVGAGAPPPAPVSGRLPAHPPPCDREGARHVRRAIAKGTLAPMPIRVVVAEDAFLVREAVT